MPGPVGQKILVILILIGVLGAAFGAALAKLLFG